MAKKRANGEGSIRKRSDGRWEGRYTVGYDENGKVKMKNVLGKTQAEVKEKLKKPKFWTSQKASPTRSQNGLHCGLRYMRSRTYVSALRITTTGILQSTSSRVSAI